MFRNIVEVGYTEDHDSIHESIEFDDFVKALNNFLMHLSNGVFCVLLNEQNNKSVYSDNGKIKDENHNEITVEGIKNYLEV